MRKKKYLYFILSILIFCFISDTRANDSLITMYAEKLSSHKHFSAPFKQSRFISLFEKPLVSTGIIKFTFPDNILLSYKTPFKSIIHFSKGSMKRYIDLNGSLVEQPSLEIVAKAITKEMMRWLSGNFLDNFPYEFKIDPSNPRHCNMIPKRVIAQSVFKSIELTFPSDYSYLEKIKLNEPNGDYILIEHEKPSFDSIPAEEFTFPFKK